MNINMKYYIVTIGSIFLALGIGIIVGFNLNYDQELSKQQSEVLSQFEEKFDSLNEEKSDLNKQIDSLNEKYDKLKTYVSQNYNLLIADALTNKNTGIILTNEKNDYSEEQLDAIAPKDANEYHWEKSLEKNHTIVVEEDDKLIAFGNIGKTGYLDRLYVHPDYLRKGIASKLVEELEEYAKKHGSHINHMSFRVMRSL